MLKRMVIGFLTSSMISIQGHQGDPNFNNQSIFFPVTYTNGVVSEEVSTMLDTGSYTLVIPEKVANELSLPVLHPENIGGIGGSEQTYDSLVSYTLDGREFTEPCVVSGNTDVAWLGMGTMRDMGVKKIYINVVTDSVYFADIHH